MSYFSNVFVKSDELEWESVAEGVRRKIMAYDDKIMLVKVEFQAGGVGAIHSHYHSQTTYVESGLFEVTIGDQKQLLGPGDAYYIPPHLDHGATALKAGVLIDVFSPMREDFVPMSVETSNSNGSHK